MIEEHTIFLPLPPVPGGEGRVRGDARGNSGEAHLTLPRLQRGPLPLPPKGGEGIDGAAR
jgi:hypothetical protein